MRVGSEGGGEVRYGSYSTVTTGKGMEAEEEGILRKLDGGGEEQGIIWVEGRR